ncbi:MAG: hypothetical protein ACLFU4_02480 [Opitutales bacterium]
MLFCLLDLEAPKYVQVGPIDRDQMQDYATRKGLRLEVCEKWLVPIRGY